MPDWGISLLMLGGLVVGFCLGYLIGYRNGAVSGELRALHATLEELRSRRRAREQPPADTAEN
jgi:hypothetical protein